MRLLDYMEKEKTVETLIKNKGLPESFVVISDSGVNVTVNTEDLDQQTVTKIARSLCARPASKPARSLCRTFPNKFVFTCGIWYNNV